MVLNVVVTNDVREKSKTRITKLEVFKKQRQNLQRLYITEITLLTDFFHIRCHGLKFGGSKRCKKSSKSITTKFFLENQRQKYLNS